MRAGVNTPTETQLVGKNGKAWVSLPGEPLVKDGRHTIDTNVKLAYLTLLERSNRAASDKEAVIAAPLAKAPHALDEEGEP
jgi:hypothetical protein